MILKVGDILANYCFNEKLGEDGMGIVWKARDLKPGNVILTR